MPPRFAYWTILIDGQPTAFRAHEREELLPTYNQLARKNSVLAMKWFAHGKLWDSPEAELAAREGPRVPFEKRNREWRPGGEHKDPRARFDKKKVHRQHTSEKPRSEPSEKPAPKPYVAEIFKPGADRKPFGKPFRKPFAKPGGAPGSRPWSNKPPRAGGDRPWSSKPPGAGGERKPFRKPFGKPDGPPRPDGARKPYVAQIFRPAEPGDRPHGKRPWTSKPPGAGGTKRPWTSKPPSAGGDARRPWSGKPDRPPAGPRGPRKPKPPEDE